jgi:DNA-binding CsgD family transcriptional regulator
MITLRMGSIPTVEFLEEDLYHVVEKYKCVIVSSQSFKYLPSDSEIKHFYISSKWDLEYFNGKKAHTEEAKKLYDLALQNIEPDQERVIKQLIKIASMLYYLGNEIDTIFNYFLSYVPRYYTDLDEKTIYEIVEIAQLFIYKPHERYVVFNPMHSLNPFFRQKIEKKILGQRNRKIVVELARKGYTREKISAKSNLSLTTVDEHLKKAKIRTTGNKKSQTIKAIRECHKNNPKWSKKRVSEHLKMSYRNVKRLWGEI